MVIVVVSGCGPGNPNTEAPRAATGITLSEFILRGDNGESYDYFPGDPVAVSVRFVHTGNNSESYILEIFVDDESKYTETLHFSSNGEETHTGFTYTIPSDSRIGSHEMRIGNVSKHFIVKQRLTGDSDTGLIAATTTSPATTTRPIPQTTSTPSPTPSLTPISTNLSSWKAEAYDPLVDEYYSPASWSLANDKESINEVQNCQPAFFYSDFSIMSRSINVNIKPLLAAEPDDDYIGFAIGFQPDDTKNHNADFLLVDWKASIAGESLNKDFISSCGPGGTAKVGLAVSRVKGIPNTDEFWQHIDQEAACSPFGEGLFELARGTSLGDQSWEFNREYKITFEFSKTSLKIYVDNNLEVDIKGNFKDGRLAFFNFSQAEVIYSIAQ
jgi:hypothetical protein